MEGRGATAEVRLWDWKAMVPHPEDSLIGDAPHCVTCRVSPAAAKGPKLETRKLTGTATATVGVFDAELVTLPAALQGGRFVLVTEKSLAEVERLVAEREKPGDLQALPAAGGDTICTALLPAAEALTREAVKLLRMLAKAPLS